MTTSDEKKTGAVELLRAMIRGGDYPFTAAQRLYEASGDGRLVDEALEEIYAATAEAPGILRNPSGLILAGDPPDSRRASRRDQPPRYGR